MFRDIYYSLLEFLRTFGALQLFFVRLILNPPSIIVRRFGLVVKQAIHNCLAGDTSILLQ